MSEGDGGSECQVLEAGDGVHDLQSFFTPSIASGSRNLAAHVLRAEEVVRIFDHITNFEIFAPTELNGEFGLDFGIPSKLQASWSTFRQIHVLSSVESNGRCGNVLFADGIRPHAVYLASDRDLPGNRSVG